MADSSDLLVSTRNGDKRSLARLITLLEAGDGDSVLPDLYAAGGNAWVTGITGPPGAGKSTLTDRLIEQYRNDGLTVAAVAVDPSSPFSGGALLGDRLRMQRHVSDEGVFVRSMSSRGRLGGLADSTSKVVVALDAAGVDIVIVETVGVGQSEVEIAELADTTVVVLPPRSGDDIQAAKAGLLEVAQVLCINKADLGGADEMVRHLVQMLELGPQVGWRVPVVTCSAGMGTDIDLVSKAVADHRAWLEPNLIADRRDRTVRLTLRALVSRLEGEVMHRDLPPEMLEDLAARRLDPWSAARRLAGG